MERSVDEGTRALVVREPWATWIVRGEKVWEIRGRGTRIRGQIAIAAAGTKCIVGVCWLTGVLGPLTLEQYRKGQSNHRSPPEGLERLPYPQTYAWCLADAVPVQPLPYTHPSGAVTWVRLPPDLWQRLLERMRP